MARVREYREGQAFTAEIQFFDSDSIPASPSTARYRIDCLTTKQTVRDWTTIDPVAQAVDIQVTSNDNRIINARNSVERRQMVVQSNYGTDTQSVYDQEWTVKNLQGVT